MAKRRNGSRTQKLITVLILSVFAAVVSAQEKDKDAEKAERDQWTKYYTSRLETYELFLESNPEDPLKVLPDAKLRWGNPVRAGRTHGELFIWTHQGKAAVIGNIFSYDVGNSNQRRVAHEFHSIAPEMVEGHRNGNPDFLLEGPGVIYTPIAGAPVPAERRNLRMVQMRRLSKQFTASTRNGNVNNPLRALDAPLYRFETKEIDDDGAVFAYVTGTDPELLVAIVTRKTNKGMRWHFGAARFTDLPTDLKFKEKSVWKFQSVAAYEGGFLQARSIDTQPRFPSID